MERKMREVIIACDFQTKEELNELLLKMKNERPYLKVGMEMYYRYGAELVKMLKGDGYKIFLDLKLHDIPTTVEKAMKQLGKLGVDITNCHTSGGIAMMKAAKEGLMSTSSNSPLLIGVTQLTSTDDNMLKNELLINTNMNDTIRHYATNAKIAGLDGVVCSPLEAPIMKELNLISVTPGIRFADGNVNDQKRIATPSYAKEMGADYIVVGRAITAAQDPIAAYEKCVNEFCK